MDGIKSEQGTKNDMMNTMPIRNSKDSKILKRRDSMALSEAAASKPMSRGDSNNPDGLGYHDHLLDDIIAEKIDHQQAKDISETNRKRNDSRSTQHLFENQFQAFSKTKDKSKVHKRRESFLPQQLAPIPMNGTSNATLKNDYGQ